MRRVTLGGGSVMTLVDGLDKPGSITVDAVYVYGFDTETDPPRTVLFRAPLAGGQATKLDAVINSAGPVADAAGTYWIEGSAGNRKLMKSNFAPWRLTSERPGARTKARPSPFFLGHGQIPSSPRQLVVAAKPGRSFVGGDTSRVAIETTRRRLEGANVPFGMNC